MEADWVAEIGPGLPILDAGWPGCVDLREDAGRIARLAEAAEFAPLAEALALLNGMDSPLLTSKCDVWPLAAEELDPFEYDSASSACVAGRAVYIDLIVRDGFAYASYEQHAAWADQVVRSLRAMTLRQGRVDLVIRAAEYAGTSAFGITLYCAGCGADAAGADAALAAVLQAAAAVTMREAQAIRASSSIG